MKNLKIIGYILAAITLLAMTYSWLATGIMLFIDFIWFTVVVKKSPVPSNYDELTKTDLVSDPLYSYLPSNHYH